MYRMYRFLMIYTSILLALFSLPTAVLVSQDWRDAILDAHNQYREAVRNCELPNQPAAKSMPALLWNRELERSAQRWADKCQLGHDTTKDRMTHKWAWVGQNVAGVPNILHSVKIWFEEHKDYDYSTNTCTDVCGHYTQVVWSSTLELGCGYRWCKSDTFLYDYLVVCNYGPGGNFIGMKPYDVDEERLCYQGNYVNVSAENPEQSMFDLSFYQFEDFR